MRDLMMTFDEWFARHVGPRPSSLPTGKLIMKARELEEEAKSTRELLLKCNDWEATRSIARTAWLAARGHE
jgi:hypothetical protein